MSYFNILFFHIAPTAPPQNISVTAEYFGELTVRWNPPPVTDRNGVITVYNIFYRITPGSDSEFNLIPALPGGQHIIKNLQENVSYDVMMQAVTSVGGGPNSTLVTAVTTRKQSRYQVYHFSLFMHWIFCLSRPSFGVDSWSNHWRWKSPHHSNRSFLYLLWLLHMEEEAQRYVCDSCGHVSMCECYMCACYQHMLVCVLIHSHIHMSDEVKYRSYNDF